MTHVIIHKCSSSRVWIGGWPTTKSTQYNIQYVLRIELSKWPNILPSMDLELDPIFEGARSNPN